MPTRILRTPFLGNKYGRTSSSAADDAALRIRRAAREELLEARAWYDAQRLGLGEEFANSIDGAVARISAHPHACPIIHEAVRRAVLLDFPYAIFYRPHTDWIEIIAVFHHRRDPRVWQARAAV